MIFKSVTLFTSATWFPQLFSSMVLPLLHHGLCSLKISSWIYRISSCGSNQFNPDFSDSMADRKVWKKGAPPHQLTSHSQPSIYPSQNRSARSASGSQAHRYVARSTWWWVNHHHWLVPSKSLGVFLGNWDLNGHRFHEDLRLGAPWFSDANTSQSTPFPILCWRANIFLKKREIIRFLSNIFRKSHV